MTDPAAATASKVAAATSLLKFGRGGIVLDDLEERALLPLERECPGCGRLMKVVLLAGAKRDGEVL